MYALAVSARTMIFFYIGLLLQSIWTLSRTSNPKSAPMAALARDGDCRSCRCSLRRSADDVARLMRRRRRGGAVVMAQLSDADGGRRLNRRRRRRRTTQHADVGRVGGGRDEAGAHRGAVGGRGAGMRRRRRRYDARIVRRAVVEWRVADVAALSVVGRRAGDVLQLRLTDHRSLLGDVEMWTMPASTGRAQHQRACNVLTG